MISLLQPVATDKSLAYLVQIFGTMNGIIPDNSGTGGAISLLGTMFKTFNSVILTVGALIIVYVTIVGLMKTAHEGEFMGKGGWSSLWVPLRTVLGIATLVPTGAGYSALQLVMMWVIIQGIGAADMIWNTALSYVSTVGSPYAQVAIPRVGATQTTSDLFKSLVCQSTAERTDKADAWGNSGGYYCSTLPSGGQPAGWCGQDHSFNPSGGNNYAMGPGGSCGTLTYCNKDAECQGTGKDQGPNSLRCLACTAQITSLTAIIPTLSGIATQLAQADYEYRDFYYNSSTQPNNPNWSWIYNYCSAQNPPISQSACCVPSIYSTLLPVPPPSVCKGGGFPKPNRIDNNNSDPQNPDDKAVNGIYWPYKIEANIGQGDFVNTAVSYYMDQISGAITSYIASQNPDSSNPALQQAQKDGWILAGGYYYAIAQMNNDILSAALPEYTITASQPIDPMSGYRNDYTAAGVLEAAASKSGGNASDSPTMVQYKSLGGMVTEQLASTMTDATSTSNHGGNPLAKIQAAGNGLLIAAQLFFTVLITITLLTGLAGNIDVFVLGTGADDPLGGTLTLLYILLVPAIYFLLGVMVSMGGLLSVYTPLIPYVVFTMGAIGWLLSTVEAMVAGPLVALSLLNPTAQHEILGSASQALMYLFQVFLRPSLMIFGLMAAMLLASVAISMIDATFFMVMQSIGAGTILGLIFFLAAYTFLSLAALNKCFAAIHIVPDRVMAWIGHQAHGETGEAALGDTKQGVSSAAQKTGAGMAGMRGKAEGYGEAAAKREKEKKPADLGGTQDKGGGGGGK